MQVPLSDPADVHGFHSHATRLLALQVAPETVHWSAPPAASLGEQDLLASRRVIGHHAARAIVPQSFVRLSELVVLHRDPKRFDLLYRALWRLVHEPELRRDLADADLARLRQMAQAVRRDIHKMQSRLVFRPVQVKGRALEVAWYEPAHHVCELVATALARRQPGSAWLLLTPDRSLRWDGERLLTAPAVPPTSRPAPQAQPAGWQPVLEALPWL